MPNLPLWNLLSPGELAMLFASGMSTRELPAGFEAQRERVMAAVTVLNEIGEIMPKCKSIRYGRGFAEKFMAILQAWSTAKPKLLIEACMYVSEQDQLTAFIFTLGQDHGYMQANNQKFVHLAAQRAVEIAPKFDPYKGDLAIFDGKKILMFRRFDESLSAKSARRAAAEVAGYILMKQKDSDEQKQESAGRCPICGSDQVVNISPATPGPTGWAARCRACGKRWERFPAPPRRPCERD